MLLATFNQAVIEKYYAIFFILMKNNRALEVSRAKGNFFTLVFSTGSAENLH